MKLDRKIKKVMAKGRVGLCWLMICMLMSGVSVTAVWGEESSQETTSAETSEAPDSSESEEISPGESSGEAVQEAAVVEGQEETEEAATEATETETGSEALTGDPQEAQKTAAEVLINGEKVDFEAYTIEGYNYFKLRDLAQALDGTEKQFDLQYDEQMNQIVILEGESYTPEKEEESADTPAGEGSSIEKEAYPISQDLYLEDDRLELTAYNIDGYNYFKLRDVGEHLDFYVGWDSENWEITIDTQKSYDKTADENPWVDPGEDIPGESAAEKETYSFEWINAYSNYFTNKVDGYTIMVPGDMQADMSESAVRAILENNDLRLEIYSQPIGGASGISAATYKNYSNHFLQETSVHTTLYNGNRTIGRYNAYVVEWFRNPLKRVENDKNYYASVDLTVDSGHIVTLLFKSNQPFDTENGSKTYLDMAATFQTVTKTAAPYTEKKHSVERTEWNEETRQAYEMYFGDSSDLTWGIFEPAAPINYLEMESHEREIGYTFPINLYYTNLPTANNNVEYALQNAGSRGRILELTLQTTETESGNMVYDALNGEYDDILKKYAKTIADYGKPVLFRLANEMNGDWCVYSAWHTSKDTEIYVEFYRYVYRIFEEAGALANTIWVWNPNEKSFPDFRWNDALCYYPGDEYVDVVGLTGYNTGTYYAAETWRSFSEIYDPLYHKYEGIYEQPFMITEFSCSKFGGDKVAWVEDMFQKIGNYSKIKVAVWWDGCDWDAQGNIARSYFINDVPGVIDMFRKYIGDETKAQINSNGEGVLPQ